MSTFTKSFLMGLAGATMLATAANAGGFSRGTADTDILFEEGNFNMRAGFTYVNPTRKYTANANPALIGTDPLDSYVVPSVAVKFSYNDASCAGTMTDAYGGAATYAAPLASGKTFERFTITEYGLTCGYNIKAGPGFATIIGGVFLEQFNYELGTALGTVTDLQGEDVGFRVGAAYSIPEIALRAQLMYRSGTQHTPTGLTDLGPFTVPASGAGQLPQSVELKVQSGVAPGWLVFGSIKWTDWSVLDILKLNGGVPPLDTQNNYFYRDGWTVSAGVGHQFNDQLSGFGALQWDRGVGTGWDLASTTWTAAAGLTLKANDNVEGTFSASYTHITASQETQYAGPLNAAFGAGHAIGLSASLKAKF